MILTAIRDRLLDDVAITDRIGDRCYFNRRSQAASYPCVVIEQRSTRPNDVLDGLPDCDQLTVELNVWARDRSGGYSELEQVANRCRVLLEGYRGELGDHYCHGATLENDLILPVSQADQSSNRISRRMLTLRMTVDNNLARV